MANTLRLILELGLMIALLIAIVLFFNQANTLDETEALLSDVQESSTSLAEDAEQSRTQSAILLDKAEATGTQSAEYAVATLSVINSNSTQAIDDVQAIATQAVNHAIATQAQIYEVFSTEMEIIASTATQANADFADLEARSTQFAEDTSDSATQAIATLNAQATESALLANLTATQVSVEIDNAIATSSARENDLTEALNAISTSSVTLDEQATQIAELSTENSQLAFIRYEQDDFILFLPDNYFVVTDDSDVDDNMSTLSAFGANYAFVSQVYADNAEDFILFAVPDEADSQPIFEYIAVSSESIELDFDVDLERYLAGALALLSDDVVVIENEVITLAGRELGRRITELELDSVTVIQVRYVLKSDNNFYSITFLTSNELFEARAELFDMIAMTFELAD